MVHKLGFQSVRPRAVFVPVQGAVVFHVLRVRDTSRRRTVIYVSLITTHIGRAAVVVAFTLLHAFMLPTGFCGILSFHDGFHFMRRQDAAVLHYNGASLRYTSLSARGCPAPEGIAFACGHMYIARRALEHALTVTHSTLLA